MLNFNMMDLFERIDGRVAHEVAREYAAPKSRLMKRGFPCTTRSGKNPKKGFEGCARTLPRMNYVPTRKDIYALDCEMCITTAGKELTRITVVNINEEVVMDHLVKPKNRIINFNTKYSGITKKMMATATENLASVQAKVLALFHSETIIVGHGLVNDMRSLKLIHGVFFDTEFIYTAPTGPRSLKDICKAKLKKDIQVNEGGHDSVEDAVTAMKLFKYFMSRAKRRRRIMEEIL
ncbi:uncharacterized protein LOC129788082 [Lutzomyia longipalpis]|uniref:uncharacterized protein LOC129788082 n=1 Tax=Lutzomyia longipalpis TaxID=7200 RepID=UPI002483A00F|nr:uncharacterized protein LOC129788082 [Lutzomyia longipalpis]